MDPITTLTAHRRHPILHAPAPHLRPRLLLNLRPKSEPGLTTAGQHNNSKLPIFSTRNTTNYFQCHVLEISDGCDVANSIAVFAARRRRSFCILQGSGAVTGVSIRQPGYSDTVVTLQGCFQILSISGSFLSSPGMPETAAGVAVFLAGGHGEVVGGSVVGELRASGTVLLMAVSFHDAAYERLPPEE